MLQTELHNPVVEKRTTYEQMVKRVADFSKTLSEDTDYLGTVYRNIQNRPFSQSTKPSHLSCFQQLPHVQPTKFHPCLVVFESWEIIYVVVSSDLSYKSLELAYNAAVFLINFKLSQHFTHLLIRELYLRSFQDPYFPILFKWTFDLIIRQPNHVDKEWPKVFAPLPPLRISPLER